MAGNYAPEETALHGPLNTDVCEYLAAAGHSVSVVTTFPHYPQWKIRKGYEGHFYLRETLGNVRVRRVRNYVPARPTALKRVLYYSSFAGAAFPAACVCERPDIVICVTPPLELAVSAAALQRLCGVPFVLWIKDLVPDVAIELGMLRNSLAIALARKLEMFAYRRASKLLVLTDGFRENLAGKGIAVQDIEMVPNWVNTEFIRPDISGEIFREKNEIDPAAFVFLHSGNIGDKQDLEILVRAAKHLEAYHDIRFVIVGDGARKDTVVAEALRLGAHNVTFLPLQPVETFPQMLASADVLTIHQRGGVTDSVIPSKILTYMASVKAHRVATSAADRSGTSRLMEMARCGMAVEAGKPGSARGSDRRAST